MSDEPIEDDEVFYDEPPFRQVPDAVAFHPDLKDVDVRVWIAFAWFARGGHGLFPGRKAIAKKVHKNSVRTIDESINRLVAAGLLTVSARYHDNGGRRSNKYRLFREPLRPEQRQARPGTDSPKTPDTPEQKSAQPPGAEICAGGSAGNCPGGHAGICTTPGQKTAQQQNETNGKREKEERDDAADATSDPGREGGGGSSGQGGLFGDDEVKTEPKPAKKRRKSPTTPAPEKLEITLQMRQWAREKGIRVDLVLETEQFLDHHRARGNEFVDWVAAWQTWMRNTLKWGPGSGGHGGGGVHGNHLPYNADDAANEENRAAFG
ncbi:helix-turn-helix domain-containing protein [Nonomuraea sp. NPDC059023]|uniref:helix-turn-helix domain-containing protein n=1 Tax=unclassified Nonomuraea TaxID=2593643 RepID=UPI003687F340